MKKYIFILLFAALIGGVSGCSSEANGPADLLKTIHELAVNKNYKELENYIYPFTSPDGFDLQRLIIKGIREGKVSGDGAYSNESLKILIDRHLDKLKPISDSLLQKDFIENIWREDEKLLNLAKTRPEDIIFFDYNKVHIFIVKVEDQYQLLFWENLTSLAENN